MKRIIALLFAALLALLPMGASAEGPLNINIATAVELAETIKGVGEVKAAEIVADREANGDFASVDDLARVKGIGQKTIENNRGLLTVDKKP